MNATIRKWDFTLDHGNGVVERTVVGKDGQVHHPEPNGHGKDGHFSADEERDYRMLEERDYRMLIEAAVSANSGSRNRRISVGPLEYDSFGLLPSDGFGRLSSEDY